MALNETFDKGLTNIAELALTMRQMLDIEGHPESFRLYANIDLKVHDAEGNLKDQRTFHNLICTAGKQKLLATASQKYIKDFAYIAIGTGTTAANATDTALVTEVARSLATLSNPDANTYQAQVTFGAGTGTGAITEVGLLDASSTGDLLMRQVFSAVNKLSADSLTVTVTIT